jgi:hypothetical protein
VARAKRHATDGEVSFDLELIRRYGAEPARGVASRYSIS